MEKTFGKRLLSWLLVFAIIIGIMPTAIAADTFDWQTDLSLQAVSTYALGDGGESIIKKKLDDFISDMENGKFPEIEKRIVNNEERCFFTGKFDGGKECFGFAKMVIFHLFGKSDKGYRTWKYAGAPTTGMEVIDTLYLKDYKNGDANSIKNAKEFFSQAKPGDVIQFDIGSNNPPQNSQHTEIVYSVDDSGITILEANGKWANSEELKKKLKNIVTVREYRSFLQEIQYDRGNNIRNKVRDNRKITLLRSDNYPTCSHTRYDSVGKCTECGETFPLAPTYNEIGDYRVKKTDSVYQSPYSQSTCMTAVKRSSIVKVTAKVINAHDEPWYEVEYNNVGGYMPVSNLEDGTQPSSGFSFFSMIKKILSFITGLSTKIGGIIKSSLPLKSVRGQIISKSRAVVATTGDILVEGNTYSLANSTLSEKLKFENLPAGTYQYQIIATDVTGASDTWTSEEFTVTAPTAQTCGKPSFSETSFNGGKRVTIASATPGATIQYSYNGKSYSGTTPVSFDVKETTTIKATASKADMDSAFSSATISVNACATPEIQNLGIFKDGLHVSITGTTGDTILYSVNGSAYQSSTGGPVVIKNGGTSTIVAYAERKGFKTSPVARESFTVTAPSTPNVSMLTGESTVAVGDPVTFQWDRQPDATGYRVYVTYNGSTVEETTESTSYTVSTPQSGIYTVSVAAENYAGSSGLSRMLTVDARDPSTVLFLDYDGSVFSTQQVRYGRDAQVPNKQPTRRGYTFIGWDSVLTRITEDTSIRAMYEINKYDVYFYGFIGNDPGMQFLGRQQIEFDKSIDVEALNINMPDGYALAGWYIDHADSDSALDVYHIDSDMTLYAIGQWENVSLPVVITDLAAERNPMCTGYDVKFKLNCASANELKSRMKKVKVIASLLTSDDQLLAAEVMTLNLNAGDVWEEDCSMVVSYDGSCLADRVEISVVGIDGNDHTGGTLAEAKSVTPTIASKYSDWMTATESINRGYDLAEADQTKTQYRYQDSTRSIETRSNTTGVAPTVDGYTQLPDETKTEWPEWSGWSDTPIAPNDNRQVDSQQVEVTPAYTQYRYGRWAYKSALKIHFCPELGKKYHGGTWILEYSAWRNSPVAKDTSFTGRCSYSGHTHVTDSGKVSGSATWNQYKIGNAIYYWQETQTIPVTYKTQYKYRDKIFTFTYEQWKTGDWSNWSDMPVTPYTHDDKKRVVETRVLYRYEIGSDSVVDLPEDAVTEERIVSGTLSMEDDMSGKLAGVLVYKETNSDPTASQLEYVGQIVIGEGNSYSCTYRPKEEPSEITGDYIVALALEGSSNVINVDKVCVPKTCKVSFYSNDLHGNDVKIGEDYIVPAGSSITPPEAPEKEGYVFLCWDTYTSEVKRDLEVHAIYAPKSHSVVFVDHENQTVVLKTDYSHGALLISQEVEPVKGMVFRGWKVIANSTGKELGIIPPATTTGGETYGQLETMPATLAENEILELPVTDDLIVVAQWEPVYHNVTFLDCDGQTLAVRQVPYGEAAELPMITSVPQGKTFVGWSTDYPWWNVTEDMTVSPLVVYEQTTTAPLPNGELERFGVSDIIELSSEEGAVIYYTTDGSDPEPGSESTKEYIPGEPIAVDDTISIRAIAIKPEENPSEIIEVDFWYVDEQEEAAVNDILDIGTYNVAVEPGTEVTLELNLKNNPGLAGYLFYVDADTNVFSVPYDMETDQSGITGGTLCGNTGTLLLAPHKEDLGWQLLWFSEKAVEGEGTLFTLTLQVSDSAEKGVYPVTVRYSPANTFDMEYVSQSIPGVTVGFTTNTDYKIGDINGDSEISNADVVMIARSVVGLYTIADDRKFLADVNNDGDITVADALYLARYLLGLEHIL